MFPTDWLVHDGNKKKKKKLKWNIESNLGVPAAIKNRDVIVAFDQERDYSHCFYAKAISSRNFRNAPQRQTRTQKELVKEHVLAYYCRKIK